MFAAAAWNTGVSRMRKCWGIKVFMASAIKAKPSQLLCHKLVIPPVFTYSGPNLKNAENLFFYRVLCASVAARHTMCKQEEHVLRQYSEIKQVFLCE